MGDRLGSRESEGQGNKPYDERGEMHLVSKQAGEKVEMKRPGMNRLGKEDDDLEDDDGTRKMGYELLCLSILDYKTLISTLLIGSLAVLVWGSQVCVCSV